MRKLLPLSSLLLVVMLLVPAGAMADLLTVNQLDPNTWQLIVTRPDSNTAIGGFDVFVGYDGTNFAPPTVDPGPYLGDPLLFESFFDVFFDVNLVQISEVSLLSNAYLVSTQPLSFTLATIHFSDSGNQALQILDADVSDGFGNPIGETPIPEPGTMILLGSGLAVLARWRKKLA